MVELSLGMRNFSRLFQAPRDCVVANDKLCLLPAVFSIQFLQSAFCSLQSAVLQSTLLSGSTSCLQLAPIAAQQRKPIKWRFGRVANCICLPSQTDYPSACPSACLSVCGPLCLSCCLVKLRLHILVAYRLSKIILIEIHFESNF